MNQDGLPLRIVLSAGQASDKAAVAALIDGLPPAPALLADRGYDARAIIDLIAAHGGHAHIPTQRDRKIQRSIDPALYRQRNLIERFFSKIKHFRRVATRFDKLARNFLRPSFSSEHAFGSELMSPRPSPSPERGRLERVPKSEGF